MNLPVTPSPLALDAEDYAWVERVRDSLSAEQQIAQLFIFATQEDTEAETREIMALAPGGIHRFPTADLSQTLRMTRLALELSEIPPILSGDIEGGTISYPFATQVPNQMGIAACNDLEASDRLARIVARESRALGYDWSFTPVVDINAEFRSAIVGTRSYGSDPETVLAQSRTYIRALQSEGLAACAKHWPGDGFDQRDQHLVTSVNPLDMDDWRRLFGRIYGGLIREGVMTVMSAHIALPAYIRALNPGAGREAFIPASLSRELNESLLRGELGFQGLIVSDATGMGGMNTYADRDTTVPMVIENGCDMFLFSRDPARDVQRMIQGLRTGLLSEQRLHEAVTRVLSFKAKLGLHRKSIADRVGSDEAVRAALQQPTSVDAARDASGRAVTLVKDVQSLLPINPERHRRVTIIAEEGWNFFSGAPERSFDPFIDALTARGFEISMYDVDAPPSCENTDLLLYLVGQEATPSASHIYLDFTKLHGGQRKGMNRYFQEIPTALISFGQPYYLFDMPGCSTAINAYSSLADAQVETVKRLTGNMPFTGVSPVDPFCGQEQLRW